MYISSTSGSWFVLHMETDFLRALHHSHKHSVVRICSREGLGCEDVTLDHVKECVNIHVEDAVLILFQMFTAFTISM